MCVWGGGKFDRQGDHDFGQDRRAVIDDNETDSGAFSLGTVLFQICLNSWSSGIEKKQVYVHVQSMCMTLFAWLFGKLKSVMSKLNKCLTLKNSRFKES